MSPRCPHLVLCAALVCLLCACTPADEQRVSVRMDGLTEPELVTSIEDVPFPSDLWRGEDGKLMALPGLEPLFRNSSELTAAHLQTLDGFGTRPLVVFPMSGALDSSAIPATSSSTSDAALVINVDDRSPDFGEVMPYEWRWQEEQQALVGSPVPGVVLESGVIYAAVVTTELFDGAGQPIKPSPVLRALREGTLSARLDTTRDALARLDTLDGLEERVAGLTVFTVQRATQAMVAARNQLASLPGATLRFDDPEIIFAGSSKLDALLGIATRFDDGPRKGQERWGSANPTGIAHDHVGVIATASLTLARFRRPATGSYGPEDGTFETTADSLAPPLQSMETIPLTIVLPAAPAPPTGYPVAIFGHGLGSSRHAVLTFAEPLTANGIAVLAIDFDGHGSRYSAMDTRNNTARLIDGFTGDPELRDGFGDKTGTTTTFDFLGGLRNFSRARDGIRQSVLDLSQLTELLQGGSLDLSALATDGVVPTLDSSSIAYLGESFGTLVGGVLAAIEPGIELYVLDVPGAGIIDLSILNSPAIASLLLPLSYPLYGWTERPDRFSLSVSLLQSLVDGADPLSFAPHVLHDRFTIDGTPLSARHLLAIEVLGDEAIPNLATNAWARAMGLELLEPDAVEPPGLALVPSPAAGNVDGQTAVLVQYGPAAHGSNWSSERGEILFVPGFPHEGPEPFPKLPEPVHFQNPIYETLEQVIDMVQAHQRGEVPAVRSTSLPMN